MPAAGDHARLAVFLSGSGRTMENLHDRARDGRLPAEIALVAASRPCPGLDKARARGLPGVVLERGPDPEALLALLGEHRAGWVVLAGYLRRLPIPAELDGRVVNIHPALLPGDGTPGRFGGRGMHGLSVHRAVLEAGERETGCTVHLCTADYDAGPVVLTKACPVLPGDTPETLAARVFALELEAYPKALARLIAGAAPTPPRTAEPTR